MIKILFFADTHLGFDHPIRPQIDRRRRGYDFFKNFNKVLNYAVEQKVDLVINGGDFFDTDNVHTEIVNLAYETVFDFAEKGIPFLIVPGNHERSVLPDSILMRHPDIFVIDEPKTVYFQIKDADIAVSGFPYIKKTIRTEFPSVAEKLLEDRPFADINLLLMHQSIEGATVGPQNYTFRNRVDVLNTKDIPDEFDCILSGHIHRRQILWTKTGKPIIYPGSIERTSIAEKDEDKGFYVLSFDRIDDEYKLADTDFVTLPARPMHEIEITFSTRDQRKLGDWLKAEMHFLEKNSILKIKCKVQETKRLLKAEFLREIIPETMNYTISTKYKTKNAS